MFSKQDFQSWGKKEVVLFASIMTRIEGRENDDLLRKYGFRGFPSLALLDNEGEKVTDKIGRDMFSMQAVANAALSYTELQPKVEAGEKVDSGKWFMARLGMGKLDVDEAKEELAGLQLSDAQKQTAGKHIFVMEVTKIMSDRGTSADDKAAKVYEFHKAGKALPEGTAFGDYWTSLLLKGADNKGDAKVFHSVYPTVKAMIEKSLEQAEQRKKAYADNERAQEYFARMIKQSQDELKRLAERAADLK